MARWSQVVQVICFIWRGLQRPNGPIQGPDDPLRIGLMERLGAHVRQEPPRAARAPQRFEVTEHTAVLTVAPLLDDSAELGKVLDAIRQR